MENTEKMQDPLKEILKEKVLQVINDAGYIALFVGGCVRDELNGDIPHDYDICTSATPEQLHSIFHDFSNVSENSEPYGVTMPLIPIPMDIFEPGNPEIRPFEIEIATMRKDITKGRHPHVIFTTSIEEDGMRRDFTINALYEDVEGHIYDPTGEGKDDIRRGLLRFVGNADERLLEDPLRAWRFVRFLATKDVESALDIGVFESICEALDYSEVSKERQLKEFTQILAGKNFYKNNILAYASGARIWETLGFTDEFEHMKETKQSFKWHAEGARYKLLEGGKEIIAEASMFLPKRIEDGLFRGLVENGSVMDHTFNVVNEMFKQIWEVGPNWELNSKFELESRFILMLAAFLHDIGKSYSELGIKHSEFEVGGIKVVEDVPKVSDHDYIGGPIAHTFCKNLGLPNDVCDLIKYLVENHMKAHKILEMKSLYKIWSFVRHPYFGWLIYLARADERGCVQTQEDEWLGIDGALESEIFVPEVGIHMKVKDLKNLMMPKPLMTGDYLIAKGEKPGPLFKKKLEKAHEFQINEGIRDPEILYQKVKGVTLSKH